MIAACPTCRARYRIDSAKLRPEGARLRCSRCENVFRVRAPKGAAPAPAVAPQSEGREVAPAPPAKAPPAPQTGTLALPPEDPLSPPASRSAQSSDAPDRSRLVLIAHPEAEQGKQIADALSSWGLQTILVHDGVEAILNIQRALPGLVILDAALPKMFGFQVCELMKRNESLRSIHVVLVGAIHDEGRYRRPPGELYGADEYIERQQLPDGLAPLLERRGLSAGSTAAPAPTAAQPVPTPAAPAPVSETRPLAPVAPEPVQAQPTVHVAQAQPTAELPPEPVQAVAATPQAAPADPALAAEVEQAGRLARIIVSDIVLYNPEKFEAGLRSGDILRALGAELEEGRTLFSQRVDPRVGAADEFLHRELLRVARSRGMD